MKRSDWQRVYAPQNPELLQKTVSSALDKIMEEKPVKKFTLRTACIALAALLILCGAAYALIESKTADVFGWFYGEDKKQELLSGDIAPSGQSVTLGDVTYTLDEVVYKDGFIYGTGTMRARDGANVVLIPEDYQITDPAGYLVYYGDETIPETAKSYAQLTKEKGATLLLAKCVADGVLNEDGTLNASEIGYTQLPQADGTIRFTFEFEGGAVEDGDGQMKAAAIARSASYSVRLYIASWEIAEDGTWLRGDDGTKDTWLKQDWTVTVTPETKGE